MSERKKRVVRHTVCLVAVFTETPDLFLDHSVYVETRYNQAACKLDRSPRVTTCCAIHRNACHTFLGTEPGSPWLSLYGGCWWWSGVRGGIASRVCRSAVLKIHSFQNYRERDGEGAELKANSCETLARRSTCVTIMDDNEVDLKG